MPFKRHPIFQPAPSEESKLWRYMGLPQYLSLLQSKSLFFCNLEVMARSDPFEGTLPASRFVHRKWESIDDIPERIRKGHQRLPSQVESDPAFELKKLKDEAELRIRHAYASRRSYFINCWHLSEFESSAMWRIYSRRNEAIAILSSESRFRAAFADAFQDIMGGRITYGEYANEDFKMDESNALSPVLHKRNSYSYEQEYRLVYWNTSVISKQIKAQNGFFRWDGNIVPDTTSRGVVTVGRSLEEIEDQPITSGCSISCDINALIDAIYVSPSAESWLLSVVEDSSHKYGVDAQVVKSDLFSEPLR
jgi:hypothetical protein